MTKRRGRGSPRRSVDRRVQYLEINYLDLKRRIDTLRIIVRAHQIKIRRLERKAA
jgi:hypothetical protein